MTVEALIFIVLGFVAVGFLIKALASRSGQLKSDTASGKPVLSTAGAGQPLKVNTVSAARENDHMRDAAPTAEMQAIGDSHAMAMAQILVSKGQVIEAVKVLHENAGYDMEKAVAAVDAMGKKVYTAD